MNVINLNSVRPLYLPRVEQSGVVSQVWDETLAFSQGKSYLILADSGRGKSSLCSLIYGIRSDYSGLVTFDDADIMQLSRREWNRVRQHSLSMLFQELCLFSELTLLENIELKNRLTRFKTKRQILEMLDSLSIGAKSNEKVANLSLGEQQRVAFVRSLCQPFQFMLLDEPISHLDENNGLVMASMLSEEIESRGAGLIVTSVGNTMSINYDKVFCL